MKKTPHVAVVAFTCLWLWGTYMWPTRVHERYIILAMPLAIILAAGLKRYWPAVVSMAIVGVAALTWNLWLSRSPTSAGGAGSAYGAWQYMQSLAYQQHLSMDMVRLPPQFWAQYDAQRAGEWPWEILVTAVSLLGYAWACGAAVFRMPQTDQAPLPTGQAKPTDRIDQRAKNRRRDKRGGAGRP
jgi:hypothetical protein